MTTIGGGYYRPYIDVGWGPTHISLSELDEPIKSATALCFEQTLEPLKFYQCTEEGNSNGVHITFPVYENPTDYPLTSTAYIVPTLGELPFDCFIAANFITSINQGTERTLIDTNAIRFNIVSCSNDELQIDPTHSLFVESPAVTVRRRYNIPSPDGDV